MDSKQKHELDFLKKKMHVEFPGFRSIEIEAAIQTAKQDSNDRKKVEARVKEILMSAKT